MRFCRGPKGRHSCRRSVRIRKVCSGKWGGNGLSNHSAGFDDAVLFDRSDFRVGKQVFQVIVGEISGVTVDDVELVGDVAVGGRDAGLGGANVGSKGHVLLEGDDVSAGDRVLGLVNSEDGGHCEWKSSLMIIVDPDRFYSAVCLFYYLCVRTLIIAI